MKRPPPRYLSASGPTNRRNANPAPRPRTAAGADTFASRSAARVQLGPGLRRQLRPTRTHRASALRLLLAALAASSGVALATVQDSALCLVAGILVGAWIVLHRQVDATNDAAVLGLGATEIDAFDRLLADIAGELTELHRNTLREIKVLIADIAANGSAEASPALEVQFYAAACVRRYVPDSLAAFVAVPLARRAERLRDATDNAIDLLKQQLDLMREELRDHRRQAEHGAIAALIRQQHFLARRTRP